jgi:hypothetical protein
MQDATIFTTAFWPEVTVLRLHHNMRLRSITTADISQFVQWLLSVGENMVTDSTGKVALPASMCLPQGSTD